MSDGLLADKVIVVTGAGGGLGRGIALEAAREGARVVVNDLGGSVTGSGADLFAAQKVANEIKALGGNAVANGERDVMLYALGIGFNADALDLREMAFTYEDGLRVAPSLCTSIWQEARQIYFRSVVVGREVVALDGGTATLKSEQHVGAV